MTIISLDRAVVTALDTFLATNQLFRIVIYNVGENPLIRNLPFFFPLLIYWFGNSTIERRGRILIGLVATCFAVFLSVTMQYVLHVHTRPVLDATLRLYMHSSDWDHQSSFPSDTAMLYFALSSVIFLVNRRMGLLAFLWAIFSAGVCRVALGWHYPSDILGSLLIAPAIVYLFSKPAFIRNGVEKALTALQEKMHIVNTLLVLFLAETYNLFPGLRSIVEILVRLARHHLDIPH
ncbi:MAG: phosphatase PAP2 family protein [Chlorobaculum sp.]|nr:phosphatase PAP2 family protein [Chlorobaculum sp.]